MGEQPCREAQAHSSRLPMAQGATPGCCCSMRESRLPGRRNNPRSLGFTQLCGFLQSQGGFAQEMTGQISQCRGEPMSAVLLYGKAAAYCKFGAFNPCLHTGRHSPTRLSQGSQSQPSTGRRAGSSSRHSPRDTNSTNPTRAGSAAPAPAPNSPGFFICSS